MHEPARRCRTVRSVRGWMTDKSQSTRWGWTATTRPGLAASWYCRATGFVYLLGLCQQAALVLRSLRPRRTFLASRYPAHHPSHLWDEQEAVDQNSGYREYVSGLGVEVPKIFSKVIQPSP